MQKEFEELWAQKYPQENSEQWSSLRKYKDQRGGPVGEYVMRLTSVAFDSYKAGAKAGAKAEREACARVCDELGNGIYFPQDCAEAIRARSNE